MAFAAGALPDVMIERHLVQKALDRARVGGVVVIFLALDVGMVRRAEGDEDAVGIDVWHYVYSSANWLDDESVTPSTGS